MAAGAAAIGGGLVNAYGSMYQGQAAQRAAEYNAAMAEQNAKLSIEKADEEERRQRTIFKRQLGDMRASFGASGVTMEGSPLEVIEDSAATAELDALTIRHQGEIQAYGYRSDAQLQRFAGDTARTAGNIGAVSALLGAGGAAASRMPSSAPRRA